MKGRLDTAVDASASMDESNVVAPVVTALDDASAAAGLPVSLAGAIRTVTETTETVRLSVEARRVSDAHIAAVVTGMGNALGTPVQSERVVDADGAPCVALTLKRAPVLATPRHPRPTTAAPVPAHPAPLLIPLGQTSHPAVVSVNLGQLSPLLVAGGARGANTLVATLLASVLVQAAPADLRLLISSNDDDLRTMLPVLEHLDAPPADARDVSAAAQIVAQAHSLVLERFTAGDDGPVGPAYLVVLDAIEDLRADPRALDRLDAVCRTGRLCGVHVLATTSDPGALAEMGLLEPFGMRIARPLRAEESRLVCGDDGATNLSPQEILCRVGYDQGAPDSAMRLTPFSLTLPEVREVIAAVALALAPEETAPDLTASAPLPAPAQEPDPAAAAHPPTGVAADHQEALVVHAATPASTPASDENDAHTIHDTPVTSGIGGGAPNTLETSAAVVAPGATLAADDPPPPTRGAAEQPAAPAGDEKLVEVSVFGGIMILAGGAPVMVQPREQRLFAALAILGPTPVRVDRLVETLFADEDAAAGLDKLQHAVTEIRLVLKKAGLPVKRAGVVRYRSGEYLLDPSLVRVDAYLFRDLLHRSATAPTTERGALLAQAVELYTGDLCGDQSLDWVEPYRYAWRKDYLEALYELALHYERVERNHLGALRVARRLASEEPVQDHYHQLVLEFLAASGDREAVDRYYQDMCATFAQYHTDMDPYTSALYERLRRRLARARAGADDDPSGVTGHSG